MGIKKKEKKNKKIAVEEELVDPREPKILTSFILWRYILPESILVLFGVLGAAISGAVPLVLIVVQSDLIDSLMPSSTVVPSTSSIVTSALAVRQKATAAADISRAATYMAIIAAVAFVGDFLLHFFMNLANDRIGMKLRKHYFDSLLDQEIGFFDIKKTGRLVADMTDTKTIQDAYSTKLGDIAKGSTEAILGIALGLRANWKMTLVLSSVGPLLFIFFMIIAPSFTYPVDRAKKILGDASAIANEILGAMRTVRSMDGEEKEKARYRKYLRKAHIWYNIKALSFGFGIGMFEFFIWGAVALACWYGGQLVVQKEMTVGEMLQVFGLTVTGVIGALMIMDHLPAVTKAIPQVNNMLKVIRRIPALPTEGGITPNKIVGSVEFKNVTFTYPSRPNAVVLKDFSLSVKPGQSVALVGASGSGKSTIVGLLERFYTADSGDILLDGVNLCDIDPRWLHRNIGIVTQEPTLFLGTIKDNILYAVSDSKELADEDVQQAAKAANAHEFITALPKGYDTLIGERGVSLSGGQKQRIAIARAMIQNPSLLLLDEATSALDTQSESVVQDALNTLMKGRTSIVIAHRLSTIVNSEVICVMNKGELKEKGTHQELLQIPNGYYARLCKKQMNMK